MIQLDYASPLLRRRFNPATGRAIATAFLIVCAFAALSATGARLIPGGPYISFHANVVPSIGCLAVIAIFWRALRTARALLRLSAAGLILWSAAVVIFIMNDIMTFCLRPYARGAFFGW